MKTYNTIHFSMFTILLFFIYISNGYSQHCDAVPFMNEGVTLQYTHYNKKGKKESTTTHKTLSISGDNNDVSALIKATVVEEKGNDTFSTEYKAYCKNGLFSLDMLRFFDHGKLSEHHKNNLNIRIDGDVLEFPNGMNPGDPLDDGSIAIKINNADDSFTLVTLTFKVFNREIIGEEEITTPAGTFMCKKVTFDFISKFGIINIKGSGIEWYYNDAMIIRSESYNKKGKLLSYNELTELQK